MSLLDRAIRHYEDGMINESFEPIECSYAHTAVSAMLKRKPQLVNHKRTFWTCTHSCPSCGEVFDKEGLKFCSNCGQALDWSNYERCLKYVR